jgi:hypothetical protein
VLASVSFVIEDCKEAVKAPLQLPLTQKEPVYFCTFTSIPHHPGFEIPTTPLDAATFSDVGRAEESGCERPLRDNIAPFTAVQGLIVDGYSVLP